tara:strand:- start:1728 stop:2165 length:438 start_codon:yes stop_codon:yes gene_type:complete
MDLIAHYPLIGFKKDKKERGYGKISLRTLLMCKCVRKKCTEPRVGPARKDDVKLLPVCLSDDVSLGLAHEYAVVRLGVRFEFECGVGFGFSRDADVDHSVFGHGETMVTGVGAFDGTTAEGHEDDTDHVEHSDTGGCYRWCSLNS